MIKTGNPKYWTELPVNTPLLFEAPKRRRIKLSLMSNGPAELWMQGLGKKDTKILLGPFFGAEEFELHVNENVHLELVVEGDTVVYGKDHAPSHIIPKRELEAYTKVDTGSRQATEMDRIMMYLQANEKKRNKELEAERLKSQQAQQKFEEATKVLEQTPKTPTTTTETTTTQTVQTDAAQPE